MKKSHILSYFMMIYSQSCCPEAISHLFGSRQVVDRVQVGSVIWLLVFHFIVESAHLFLFQLHRSLTAVWSVGHLDCCETL